MTILLGASDDQHEGAQDRHQGLGKTDSPSITSAADTSSASAHTRCVAILWSTLLSLRFLSLVLGILRIVANGCKVRLLRTNHRPPENTPCEHLCEQALSV